MRRKKVFNVLSFFFNLFEWIFEVSGPIPWLAGSGQSQTDWAAYPARQKRFLKLIFQKFISN